jgi:hypothetical protein
MSDNDWTVSTLKEHFDELRAADQRAVQAALASAEKAVSAALTASKEAVTKAETASEKRFDSVNEFRKTLSDQTSTFLPRPEYEAKHENLKELIAQVDKKVTLTEGAKTGSGDTWKNIVTIVGVGIAIITFIGLKG